MSHILLDGACGSDTGRQLKRATMNNAASRKVSVTMSRDGIPIAAAEPGSTIVLNLQVQRTIASPLSYRWDAGSAQLVAADAASATVKLPPLSRSSMTTADC
jgi:hypothetical protein